MRQLSLIARTRTVPLTKTSTQLHSQSAPPAHGSRGFEPLRPLHSARRWRPLGGRWQRTEPVSGREGGTSAAASTRPTGRPTCLHSASGYVSASCPPQCYDPAMNLQGPSEPDRRRRRRTRVVRPEVFSVRTSIPGKHTLGGSEGYVLELLLESGL